MPNAYSGFSFGIGHGELQPPAFVVHHSPSPHEAGLARQMEGEHGGQLPSQHDLANEAEAPGIRILPSGASKEAAARADTDADSDGDDAGATAAAPSSSSSASGSVTAGTEAVEFWRGEPNAEWAYRVLRQRQLQRQPVRSLPTAPLPDAGESDGGLQSGVSGEDLDRLVPPTRVGLRFYGERIIGEDADIAAWRRAPLQRRRLPPVKRMFEHVQQEAEAHRAFIAVRRIHLRAAGLTVGEDDEDDEDPHLVRAYAGHSAGGVEPKPSSQQAKHRLKALFDRHGDMTARDTDRIMRGLFFIDQLGTEDVHFGVCAGCGCGGNVVMCDKCACVWHEACAPDLASKGVPDGKWACPMCVLFPGHSDRLLAELREDHTPAGSDAPDSPPRRQRGGSDYSDSKDGGVGGGSDGAGTALGYDSSDADHDDDDEASAGARHSRDVLRALISAMPPLQDVAGGLMISPDASWTAVLQPLHLCINDAVIQRGTEDRTLATGSSLATTRAVSEQIGRLPHHAMLAVAAAEDSKSRVLRASETTSRLLQDLPYRGVSGKSVGVFRVQLPSDSGSVHLLQTRDRVQAARAFDVGVVAVTAALAPQAIGLARCLQGGPTVFSKGAQRLWLNFPGRLPEYVAAAMLAWRIALRGARVPSAYLAWLPDWQRASTGLLVAALKAIEKFMEQGAQPVPGKFFADATPAQAVEFLSAHGFSVALGGVPPRPAASGALSATSISCSAEALHPLLLAEQTTAAPSPSSRPDPSSTVLAIRRRKPSPTPQTQAQPEAAPSAGKAPAKISAVSTAGLAMALSAPCSGVLDPSVAVSGVTSMRSSLVDTALAGTRLRARSVVGWRQEHWPAGQATAEGQGSPDGVAREASAASRRICKSMVQHCCQSGGIPPGSDPILCGPTPMRSILASAAASKTEGENPKVVATLFNVTTIGTGLIPMGLVPAMPTMCARAVTHGWRQVSTLASKRFRDPEDEFRVVHKACSEAAALLGLWAVMMPATRSHTVLSHPSKRVAEGRDGDDSPPQPGPPQEVQLASQRWLQDGALMLLCAGFRAQAEAQPRSPVSATAAANTPADSLPEQAPDSWERMLPDAVSTEDEGDDDEKGEEEAQGENGPGGKTRRAVAASHGARADRKAPDTMRHARIHWASQAVAAIGSTGPQQVMRGGASGIGLAAVRALNGRPCLPSQSAFASQGRNHVLIKGSCRKADKARLAAIVDACGAAIVEDSEKILYVIQPPRHAPQHCGFVDVLA
jgi:hypothetical protein